MQLLEANGLNEPEMIREKSKLMRTFKIGMIIIDLLS